MRTADITWVICGSSSGRDRYTGAKPAASEPSRCGRAGEPGASRLSWRIMARLGAAAPRLEEAQVALGHAGLERELQLGQAAPPAPAPEQAGERRAIGGRRAATDVVGTVLPPSWPAHCRGAARGHSMTSQVIERPASVGPWCCDDPHRERPMSLRLLALLVVIGLFGALTAVALDGRRHPRDLQAALPGLGPRPGLRRPRDPGAARMLLDGPRRSRARPEPLAVRDPDRPGGFVRAAALPGPPGGQVGRWQAVDRVTPGVTGSPSPSGSRGSAHRRCPPATRTSRRSASRRPRCTCGPA